MTDPTQAYPVATLNNIETDDQWEAFTGGFTASGVNADTGPGSLQVSLNVSARTAVLAPGGAYIRGRYRPPQSAAEQLAIPAASSQDRYDRVAMRLNRSAVTVDDVLKPVIITGTPSNSPVKPAFGGDSQFTYIPLASYRAAASGTLTQLVDERRFIGLAARSAPTDIGVPAGIVNGSLWWQTDGVNGLGQLMVKQKTDGTHIVAAQDSGWVNLSDFGTRWEGDNSFTPAVAAKNGFGCITGAAVRKDTDFGATGNSTNMVKVPAAYLPGRVWTGSAVFGSDPPGVGRIRIDPDTGWVSIAATSRVISARTGSDQSTGTHIYLSHLPPWPIG